MKDIYIRSIATRIGVREWQVENCIKLFEEGATIPFISRYRKERTGGLDEVAVAEIRHWADVFNEIVNKAAPIVNKFDREKYMPFLNSTAEEIRKIYGRGE